MVLQAPQILADLSRVETLMCQLAQTDSFDIVGPMALEHLAAGGKRLRARLALAACESLGVAAPAAVAWAAACELAHNATLVHDDLQDGDKMRRGQPTTWVRHGVAQAINTGDLMLMLPTLALDHPAIPAATAWALARLAASKMATVIRGQGQECDLTAGGHYSRERYYEMISGKTSALFELPVAGAALLSGAPSEQAALLVAPFAALGAVFQMQDDVLDLFGDKGRDRPGSDLREGKISALVVEHVALHPEDAPWLFNLLRLPRHQTPDDTVVATIERFAKGGALSAVLAEIRRQSERARHSVTEPLRALLVELVELVLMPIAHLS